MHLNANDDVRELETTIYHSTCRMPRAASRVRVPRREKTECAMFDAQIGFLGNQCMTVQIWRMRKVICMVGIWGAFLWIVYLQQDIFWRGHKLPPTIPWATVLHARTQRVKRICQKYNLTQANKQVSSKRLRILCFPSLKVGSFLITLE